LKPQSLIAVTIHAIIAIAIAIAIAAIIVRLRSHTGDKHDHLHPRHLIDNQLHTKTQPMLRPRGMTLLPRLSLSPGRGPLGAKDEFSVARGTEWKLAKQVTTLNVIHQND